MKREIVSAKIDVVFKELFIRERSLLKNFISDVLDIPFENILDVTLTNPEMPSDYADGKLVRLDLSVKLRKQDGMETLVNVELQVNSQSYFKKRTLFYWSKLYTSELRSGESYKSLKRTICINILNFNITDKQDYHTEIIAADKDTGEPFTDLLSIHFFELRKVTERVDVNDRKTMWMQLIKADTEEKLNMIKNTNIPAMKQAVQVIFDMSADTVLRERARIREKALHDEASALEGAREEGLKEGLEKAKKVFKLSMQGYDPEKIAEILSISEDEVKSILS
ncbi:MAG: Rpn family recombination-promoting nuclease/putative transposase [Oscillospiraceae bacterium]|nr:Rpn family recombination-promoting nuclease/putative transposase [Oscillospiraceae bacterium]